MCDNFKLQVTSLFVKKMNLSSRFGKLATCEHEVLRLALSIVSHFIILRAVVISNGLVYFLSVYIIYSDYGVSVGISSIHFLSSNNRE